MCDLLTLLVSSLIIPVSGVGFGNLNFGLGMCARLANQHLVWTEKGI